MSGRPFCPTCSLRHSPRCVQVPQRWPLAPLASLVAADARQGRGRAEDIANAIGVERVAVDRAAEYGLSDQQADRWAVRCGHHPAAIWPGWIDAGLTVRDRQFIDEGWRHAWLHAESAPSRPETEAAA